jgi:hypothetical protein
MTVTGLTQSTRRTRPPPRGRPRRQGSSVLSLTIVLLAVLACGGTVFTAYLLWPRWPAQVSIDAPSLPVTVAGVAFNVPPAAIRIPVQRRAGAHERLDLAFLWPSLTPPDPLARTVAPPPGAPPVAAKERERIFVTISIAGETLAPAERLKTIYPRYTATGPVAGPGDLATLPFRDGTPYQGEDLIYDPATAMDFVVRCSRDGAGATPGTCLFNRRIDSADLLLRFPRDWLGDWRTVAANIEVLVATLRPARTLQRR